MAGAGSKGSGRCSKRRSHQSCFRPRYPISMVRTGSIFWLALQPGPPPRSAEAIEGSAAERYRALFGGLQRRGVNMAPSAYEVGFLSLAHESADIDAFATALGESLMEVE